MTQDRVRLFHADLTRAEEGIGLVEAFVAWAGGIDVLVQLSGGIAAPVHWRELTPAHWESDLALNLVVPFFMAQTAMRQMEASGGRIILMSTASARHGGGRTSMAYGVAKAGIECMTKGLARDGAQHNILVNAICPGFIDTPFHTDRMHRTPEELSKRGELVPLGRPGSPRDVAGLIAYLASHWGDYITGECIPISGGDWL
jgi:3-oxoacyl-[acyl-carrier protein] reductase